MITKFSNFRGSRKELMSIISTLEKESPENYKMYSKKYKKYLPVNLRRLQQFSEKGLIPNAEIVNKSYVYNFEHLLRYIAIMKLKNEGYTLIQSGKIIKDYDNQKLLEFLQNQIQKGKELIDYKNTNKRNEISEKLIKLGRDEGRVLRSQWIRFAITKWCNCEVMNKELKKLTEEDVNTLAEAFKESLLDTIKLKYIEKHIR